MEKIIHNIDPSLEYIQKLKPSSALVYEVKKDNQLCVLKLTKNTYQWGIDHLQKEKKVLSLARDVCGITHLVKTYEEISGYKNPLLKEFYEGKTLEELEERIKDTKLQRKLENTIRELHLLGIARFDLEGESNIVISPDKKDIYLIDLGYCNLRSNVSKDKFERLKSLDYEHLERFVFN